MVTDKNILIQGGMLCTNTGCEQMDILVQGEKIVCIAQNIPATDAMQVVNAGGKIVTYGLVDVHVHFREPGYGYKETIATGSRAAAHGGYTLVCPMPNLSPAPDAVDTLAVEKRLIAEQAVIDVRPYATITEGRKGLKTVDFAALKAQGVAGFSDDGSGVQTESVMEEAMREVQKIDGIIAAHCEDNTLLHGGYIHEGRYAKEHQHKGICSESEWGQIQRDVALAEKTGCRYHVCHISTKESVDIIRQAKKRGVKVTCETGPHYLVLCEDDLQEEGRFKMNPPLRSKEDQEALLQGIQDGTIDCIATDHAPHSAEEKSRGLEKSAMGIVGLETAFPVVYTKLVKTGVISLQRMLELMCYHPRRIFKLGGSLQVGEYADLSIFDLEQEYKIDSDTFLSKGKSTPFDGWNVYGKCLLTSYHGDIVWQDPRPLTRLRL